MRQVREILRLKYEQHLAHRAIARACGVGLGTVAEYCRWARAANLTWPLPAEWDDAQLEARLFRRVGALVGVPRPLPDMAWLHQELKRPGVTLQRFHLEYLQQHPDGYRYSQFCRHYQEVDTAPRPDDAADPSRQREGLRGLLGEEAGPRRCQDGGAGRGRALRGRPGGQQLCDAEACAGQDLASWISAHVRMVEFFGGAPAIFVPDNLRSGVIAPCRYEPVINRTYLEFA